MKTVAVIQPYFVPYAGYFRLFEAADYVVMFDCVQFPRRGWVHRNRFRLANGEYDWLTLALEKADRSASIASLRFAPYVKERLEETLPRFPLLASAKRNGDPSVDILFSMTTDLVTPYLIDVLRYFSNLLNLRFEPILSSSLQIDPTLRGQDRVIAIVQAMDGTRYVNPSGGRALYDTERFSASGIDLRFLTDYRGDTGSILARILTDRPEAVAADIRSQTLLLS